MYEEISRAARGGEEALEVIHSHFEPKFLAEKSERREQKVRRDRASLSVCASAVARVIFHARPIEMADIGSRPTNY